MKILCACCQKKLTQDLYYVKAKYDRDGYLKRSKNIYKEQDEYFHGKSIKKGLFFITKEIPAYSWTDCDVWGDDYEMYNGYHQVIPKLKPKIVISKDSFLEGVIPPNPKNCCCNWGDVSLVCECGHKLGMMYFDCHQDGSAHFDIKSVIRCYK